MKKLLEVEGLCFHYPNIEIFKDVNFKIYEGDFIGIFGENGAGKSTFIKLLLGELKACSGSLKWFDEDIKAYRSWEKIGYVPQKTISSNLSFPATVKEVVCANLYKDIGRFCFPRKKHLDKVKLALQMVGMKGFIKRKIGELSGGQLQRVYIARALVNSPSILVLDEPTAGVDEQTVNSLFETLHHLNLAHKITIIMITHDIDKAKEFMSVSYEVKNMNITRLD